MRPSLSASLPAIGAFSRAILGNVVFRITGLVLLLAAALAGLILWQYWTSIFKDAQSRTSTLAYLLAEQTTRTFQAVDLTLTGLEAVHESTPLPPHAPAFEHLLMQRVHELDFIRALYVVDPFGQVTQTSREGKDVLPVLSVESYLQRFARDPSLKFIIGTPLFSEPGMLSAIPVVRRFGGPANAPNGMIVASVDPKHFRNFYRSVDLGRRASINLYQDNGSILLASTAPNAAAVVPPVAVTPPTFDNVQLGLLRTRSRTADQQLIAYHRAQGYPLVVAVGIDIRELRSRWWRIALPIVAALAVLLVMGIAVAILVARRLEERRQARSRAMMMQKLEALGQMTASVSHDFRNLLAVMHSTVRLIRKQGPTERILSAAEEAIERGSGLVTQLLAFSRRQSLEVKSADLNALIGGLAQVLEHAAGPDVVLRFEPTPGLPACRTDQTQFDAALMNLVVNARQAMPGGGTVTIATRRAPGTDRQADFVEVLVADSGVGIAPGHLRRIFDPFFTTKAETGTGLGLSQVYGFMQQIGGDVTVNSTVGAGTAFTLKFPVAPAESQPTPERTSPSGVIVHPVRREVDAPPKELQVGSSQRGSHRQP